MIILDTNAVLRFFLGDIPEQLSKVQHLLETEKSIYLPDVVLPEIEYVIFKKYGQNRDAAIQLFKSLVTLPNIKTTMQLKLAVRIYEDSKLDMADCIIAAYAQKGKLASFDKDLLKVSGIKGYWKV